MQNKYAVYEEALAEELIPAMGCTEPIAIAYCAAVCREQLGAFPEDIEIWVSRNIIKNVKSVVVPNTNKMKGIEVACAANLMRPAIYGSYHHITVMGKENAPCDHKYDVTGGLCENNDKFAVDRMLPEINIGDLLFIHDAGAHGFSMGYNYNGKLRSAELLLQEDGSVKMIRRAETPADYFATFDFGEYGPKLAEEAKIKM